MLKDIVNNYSDKDIKSFIENLHPYDFAEMFKKLNDDEKLKVQTLLSDGELASLVSYLEADEGADILSEFDLEKQKSIVELMEPDDAVDLIQELEDDEQETLSVLGNDAEIASLIDYSNDKTGSAMTNQVIIIHPEMDVKEATKKVIKEAPLVETISTIFVTDAHGQFLGIVPLKKLLKAKSPMAVAKIIQDSPYVLDKDPITASIQAINNYVIYEMPVLNEHHRLLGMITLDDALDIYQEQAEKDFGKLAALPDAGVKHNFFSAALHRAPWLLILLALSIPISLVTSLFEEVIATVAILIIFQPLILDSAGNVATQTLAVTLKMLSTNEHGLLKNSIREILTGIMNGFVIGLVAVVMTFIFSWLNPSLGTDPIAMASVIGISLWITVMLAPVIAILIPVALNTLKFDPAIASGPFITTLIDVSALVIYFGLAMLFLGGAN